MSTCDTQDELTREAVNHLREGRIPEFAGVVARLEYLSNYTNSVPSRQGFSNLCHILQGLATYVLKTTKQGERHKAFEHLLVEKSEHKSEYLGPL